MEVYDTARPATKTTQEKINDVKENIVKKENELKQLKAALKELEAQKVSEEKDELYKMIKEKNITVEELGTILEKSK